MKIVRNSFTVPFGTFYADFWIALRNDHLSASHLISVFACITLAFNPIPGRLKKVQKRAGGVNLTPLLHFGHCSQNYICDSHVFFCWKAR